MKKDKVTFYNSKKEKLVGFVYVPKGKGPFPAVVHIHGFGAGTYEHKTDYLCNELAKVGIVALQFDMYDKPMGRSEPKIEDMSVSGQIDATKNAIKFILTLPYVDKKRIGLTGHSLGSMAVLLYAPTDKRVKVLVPQSPASNFKDMFDLFQYTEKLDLKNWKKTGWRDAKKAWGNFDLKYYYYEEGLKYDVYKTAEKIKVPTLVLHGAVDKVIPVKHSKELIKHIKNGKLEIIKGADHKYTINNTLPVATSLIVNWFKEYL